MTDMIVTDSGETDRLVIGWIAPLEEKIIASAVWLTVWIFVLDSNTNGQFHFLKTSVTAATWVKPPRIKHVSVVKRPK